jgi:hypothetical protein
MEGRTACAGEEKQELDGASWSRTCGSLCARLGSANTMGATAPHTAAGCPMRQRGCPDRRSEPGELGCLGHVNQWAGDRGLVIRPTPHRNARGVCELNCWSPPGDAICQCARCGRPDGVNLLGNVARVQIVRARVATSAELVARSRAGAVIPATWEASRRASRRPVGERSAASHHLHSPTSGGEMRNSASPRLTPEGRRSSSPRTSSCLA